jgi:hypothetical protein
MVTSVAAAYPLDSRTTEQRVIDALRSPEVLSTIQTVVEEEVNRLVETIVATVFPALAGASSLRYEMRREGNGVWVTPTSMQNLVTAFKHGRTIRLVAEFEASQEPVVDGVAS